MKRRVRAIIAIILAMVMSFGCLVTTWSAEADQFELLAQYYDALGDKTTATQYRNMSQDILISAKIMALQSTYPEGMTWNDSSAYKTVSKGRGNSGVVYACQAFAYAVQDAVFGPNKVKYKQTNLVKNVVGSGSYQITLNYYPETDDYGCWEISGYNGDNPVVNQTFEKMYAALRVGDIVCDSNHAVVVISKDDNGITVAEGNRGGLVHWGRRILKESLRRGMVAVETVY